MSSLTCENVGKSEFVLQCLGDGCNNCKFYKEDVNKKKRINKEKIYNIKSRIEYYKNNNYEDFTLNTFLSNIQIDIEDLEANL